MNALVWAAGGAAEAPPDRCAAAPASATQPTTAEIVNVGSSFMGNNIVQCDGCRRSR